MMIESVKTARYIFRFGGGETKKSMEETDIPCWIERKNVSYVQGFFQVFLSPKIVLKNSIYSTLTFKKSVFT